MFFLNYLFKLFVYYRCLRDNPSINFFTRTRFLFKIVLCIFMKLYCFHLDVEINIIFLQYYYNSRYFFRWYIPEITTVKLKQSHHTYINHQNCNKILSTSLYLSYKRVQKKDYKTDFPREKSGIRGWETRKASNRSKKLKNRVFPKEHPLSPLKF